MAKVEYGKSLIANNLDNIMITNIRKDPFNSTNFTILELVMRRNWAQYS
jgi:hypothetical protein